MTKPSDFLQSVWDKLPENEKKEIYLNEILTSEKVPRYLTGLFEAAQITLDLKIEIAEKIINDQQLTPEEMKIIKKDIVD